MGTCLFASQQEDGPLQTIFFFPPLFVKVIKTINTSCARVKEQFFIWVVSTSSFWYGQKTFMHMYSTCINSHLKAFCLPIKTYWMKDMGPGLWKVWRGGISSVLNKIWFQPIQRISHRKNDVNYPDFEGLGFQITIFEWWVPVGRQEYRTILFFFSYFHIWYVAKFG
jgi:hypothetical protein